MTKVKVTFFLDKESDDSLNSLSKYTRVAKSEYIREGIKAVLDKYKKELMLIDAGKIRFHDIGPILIRLIEEGKHREAEHFEEAVIEEIKELEKLIRCAKQTSAREVGQNKKHAAK